jgi:L-ascorbate metabolism protein UlaG (beta-lactamase superfamily)
VIPDRITYVGHATVLLELGGARLITDPLLRPGLLGVIARHPPQPTSEVTEPVDAILVSHLHHDHLDFPSLKRFDRATRIVVPAGGARTLRRRGFTNSIELSPGERAAVGAAEVAATPAVHEGRRFKLGPRVESVGYEIEAGGRRVYFAGDTDLFPQMDQLAGRIDVALLPIAGWGPRLGEGHLNPRTAAEAVARIRPRAVVPIHWGTLIRRDMRRRAREFLGRPPRRFAAQVRELAPEVEVAVLEPGESLELPDLPRRSS